MATVYLGRSDSDFMDRETPRSIVAMLNQWREIEHFRAKQIAIYTAYAMNGKDIPDIQPSAPAKKKYVDSFYF